MLNHKITKFKNGLRLVTAPLANTRAVTILFLHGVGSRYEKQEESGIAHFLEHMFFKGTYKRPKTIDIARTLDSVGANYNAYTGDEYTGYFVRVANNHFDLGLDVLTDMLYNSKFDATEIEREKGVIVEEINMIKDVPQSYVEYVMKELLWPNQPLGRIITGTRETVTSFNRDTFTSFKDRFYQPENTVMVVAGGGNEDEWIEKIGKILDQKENKKIPGFEKAESEQKEPSLKVFYKDTDQAHFVIGYRGLKRTDPRRKILKVMNKIMGGTMSSRLFIEVRERRGLCYYISSDIADYQDTGFWGAQAGVDIKRTEEAVKVILEQFNKAKVKEVTNEELNRGKENYKGQLFLGLEESMNVAEFLAEQELFWNKIEDPDEIGRNIDAVTKDDILKLNQEIFRPENLNLAIVGPFKDEEKFRKLLNK